MAVLGDIHLRNAFHIWLELEMYIYRKNKPRKIVALDKPSTSKSMIYKWLVHTTSLGLNSFFFWQGRTPFHLNSILYVMARHRGIWVSLATFNALAVNQYARWQICAFVPQSYLTTCFYFDSWYLFIYIITAEVCSRVSRMLFAYFPSTAIWHKVNLFIAK